MKAIFDRLKHPLPAAKYEPSKPSAREACNTTRAAARGKSGGTLADEAEIVRALMAGAFFTAVILYWLEG